MSHFQETIRPVAWIAQDLRCILTEPKPMTCEEALEAMEIIDEARTLDGPDAVYLLRELAAPTAVLPKSLHVPPQSPATFDKAFVVIVALAGIFSGFCLGILAMLLP